LLILSVSTMMVCLVRKSSLIGLVKVIVRTHLLSLMFACMEMGMFLKSLILLRRCKLSPMSLLIFKPTKTMRIVQVLIMLILEFLQPNWQAGQLLCKNIEMESISIVILP
jgi:hypothetical protein